MHMRWFTADFHLGHANIIKYCNRPFASWQEMDEKLLDNLASMVHDGDTLYYLGDLTFNFDRAIEFLKRFSNIKLHFIPGNHDSSKVLRLLDDKGVLEQPIVEININGHHATLCHYAMRTWNKSYHNAWQLHAHSHGGLPPVGKQLDVGVDNNKYMPFSEKDIETIMDARPDNENFIKEGSRGDDAGAADG